MQRARLYSGDQRVKMSGVQTLKCLFTFVPFFVLAVCSGSIYDDLHSNDVPDTIPARKVVLAGQGITAIMSCLALVWNFVEFVPSFQMRNPAGFLFVSCVDFLIGSLLLLAVGLQSTYLPHTAGRCNDALEVGLAAPDNTTNLFRFMGQLDDDTPQDECQVFMTAWIMGIVLGLLSLLSSYSAFKEAQNPPVGRYGRRAKGIDLVGWFIGLLPRFLTTPVKYALIWLKKWSQRRSKPQTFKTASLEMVVLTPGPPKPRTPLAYRPRRNPRLVELLSSYPIMTAVAEGLHYADLIQLSMVSKDVYNAIFPKSKPASTSSLKRHCCLNGHTSACECCKIQICLAIYRVPPKSGDYCGALKYMTKPDTMGHLNHCTQYCSKCFRNRICHTAGPRELSSRCSCDADRGTFEKGLCRFCYVLPDSVAKARIEKKEYEELQSKTSKQVNCGGCSKRLPSTGPRWWACGRCGKGCRSRFHPQWAGAAEA